MIVFSCFADAARGGDWPQWLGPRRDGHAAADSPAIERLAPELKIVWRKKIGGGFSSPVVDVYKRQAEWPTRKATVLSTAPPVSKTGKRVVAASGGQVG